MATAEGGGTVWPWLAAGGGATAAIWWAQRDGRALVPLPSLAAEVVLARGVFPVPMWHGRRAEISDGWGSPRDGGVRRHRGADLMFRRRSRGELVAEFPPGSPDGSRGYFMPHGHPAIAVADAVVWSAGLTSRGFAVILDHGAPWATFYQHLSELHVAPTTRGASRQRVTAGQSLGVIGGNPSLPPHLRHLHFEIWRGGPATHAIDPAPMLARWEHLLQPARSKRAEA